MSGSVSGNDDQRSSSRAEKWSLTTIATSRKLREWLLSGKTALENPEVA
jgi:hypothetical protein